MTHHLGWSDDGTASVQYCGDHPILNGTILTAPNGPMGGLEGDQYYARQCPVCKKQIVLRWDVRVETLEPK